MIVSGGENVFPQEVEDVLAATPRSPTSRSSASRTRSSASGCGRTSSSRERRPEDELKAHVRAHLARFKVPRDVVFVDELPRNPTGKVLRSRLASPSGGATTGR